MAKAKIRAALEKAVDAAAGTGGEKPDRLQDYLDCISAYEREYKKWEGRVEKIVKRYRGELGKSGDEARFNILWSNVNTLVPACFSRLPQPDVSRRFRDQDQVGRVAALILERALEFEVQHYADYRQTMRQSVFDRFLGGRGTSWARYEPHFKAGEERLPQEGLQVTEDVDGAGANEALDYECAPTDYVHWKDFGHDVARTWEEVTKVWRAVYMNEPAFLERFPEKDFPKLYLGGKPVVPFDATPEDLKRSQRDAQANQKKQAKVYELWDKEKNCAVWLSKSFKDFLDERQDPLGLQEFFPCPKPLYGTITNDSLIPEPDFSLYQDQARALDTLADRIMRLAQMLQVKGVYDGSADSALGRLFTEGENGSLLPVKNWAAFAEKQGLKGQIDVLDLTMITQALIAAAETAKVVKEEIYEITGISDIIRGQTAASETATAQQIKGQYASLRLRSMQEEVARYATEILQLKAQIICGKFAPQTLAAIAAVEQLQPDDQKLVPQAIALLVGPERMQDPTAEAGPNPLRSFRIEVAADTLVQLDEQTERQDRMQMLTAFGTYIEQAAQVGGIAPQMIPLLVEVGKFGLTSFKVGKSIEGTFDQALEQLKQQAANPQPKPNPEMAKITADATLAAKKHEDEMALQRQEHADSMQLEREKMAGERDRHNAELGMKERGDSAEREQRGGLEREKIASDERRGMAQVEASRKPTAEVKFDAKDEIAGLAGELKAMSAGNSEALVQVAQTLAQAVQVLAKAATDMAKAAKAMAAPRRVVRGADGRAEGSEPVVMQ